MRPTSTRLLIVGIVLSLPVNVAVAWAFAWGHRPPFGAGWTHVHDGPPTDGERAYWRSRRPPDETDEVVFVSRLSRPGLRLSILGMGAVREDGWSVGSRPAWLLDAGWPWRAMRCSGRQGDVAPAGSRAVAIAGDALVVRAAGRRIHLPLVPRPVPLIANALVYSAIFVGGPWVLAGMRSRARRARGRCPSCGYPIARSGSTTCPECGRADRAA
ncbi:MAG: hypothetical protein ACYTJ0_02230 [Planctomycetota bacterium]